MPLPRPRKRFGQHFLNDPGIIRRLIEAIHPLPGQHLVEIGPGRAALTLPLLRAAGQLDVIEIDRDLIPLLEPHARRAHGLRIHQADALNFDLKSLADGDKKLRVVGNLPYNISTPLLFHLFEQLDVIQDLTLMLQREVAERLNAAPGGKTYGRLSVMAQYHVRPVILFDVGPGAFSPPPKVHSSVVRLVPRTMTERPAVHDWPQFERLVAAAFSARRKTLRNALRAHLRPEDFSKLDIDPALRPERLTAWDYVKLANFSTSACKKS
ncbi:MAG TPA: 16S rRNA (adenine(1518)-N(6)/adenine(1519)-N(6))-dimethyltransferase RsmA [Gammaproteobacteria bacterium]|nr:16S rRNA (adenine(1518)-N(6)/adenine(1519)-N(6))-dimethyltransferase RsmA [Gammaproteobacteria bacterium]